MFCVFCLSCGHALLTDWLRHQNHVVNRELSIFLLETPVLLTTKLTDILTSCPNYQFFVIQTLLEIVQRSP